jgi:hypothetical protein
MNDQIKSKQRVVDHGEVFTNEREVNAMLDLVKQETERIDSRFLEPACGSGNFLDQVLKRKLLVVTSNYIKKQSDYEKYSFLAVSSIYGVELLQDNVDECINRLFKRWYDTYKNDIKCDPPDNIKNAIQFVLKKNILCGDALTLLKDDGYPIIFAQWDFVTDTKIKRKDYRLDELLIEDDSTIPFEIDSKGGIRRTEFEYDPSLNKMMPKAIREFPLIDYWKIQEVNT